MHAVLAEDFAGLNLMTIEVLEVIADSGQEPPCLIICRGQGYAPATSMDSGTQIGIDEGGQLGGRYVKL